MKNEQDESEQTDMLPEYDLAGKQGVRGKYHKAYQRGHSVRIHEDDDSVTVHYFTLEDGAVLLQPDVREHFPDSESVDEALRTLIDRVPPKPEGRTTNSGDHGVP
ncbi:MAG: hypothetical protein V1792_17885 [Pseudomonadota bacterium]